LYIKKWFLPEDLELPQKDPDVLLRELHENHLSVPLSVPPEELFTDPRN
tara:strand:+ start:1913 stop:2059 length:147 start_codon:yes stop_codon:yes gene_type:complete